MLLLLDRGVLTGNEIATGMAKGRHALFPNKDALVVVVIAIINGSHVFVDHCCCWLVVNVC